MTDREDKIRQRAYGIWEEEGYPHGRDADHWHRAMREIDGTPPVRKAAPAKKAAPARRKAATGAVKAVAAPKKRVTKGTAKSPPKKR